MPVAVEVSEIHACPSRSPRGFEEPLFPTVASKRAVVEHLLKAPGFPGRQSWGCKPGWPSTPSSDYDASSCTCCACHQLLLSPVEDGLAHVSSRREKPSSAPK